MTPVTRRNDVALARILDRAEVLLVRQEVPQRDPHAHARSTWPLGRYSEKYCPTDMRSVSLQSASPTTLRTGRRAWRRKELQGVSSRSVLQGHGGCRDRRTLAPPEIELPDDRSREKQASPAWEAEPSSRCTSSDRVEFAEGSSAPTSARSTSEQGLGDQRPGLDQQSPAIFAPSGAFGARARSDRSE